MQTEEVEDEIYVPIELKVMIEAAEEPVTAPESVAEEPVNETVEPPVDESQEDGVATEDK